MGQWISAVTSQDDCTTPGSAHYRTHTHRVYRHMQTHNAGCRQVVLGASSVTWGEIWVKVNLLAKPASTVVYRTASIGDWRCPDGSVSKNTFCVRGWIIESFHAGSFINFACAWSREDPSCSVINRRYFSMHKYFSIKIIHRQNEMRYFFHSRYPKNGQHFKVVCTSDPLRKPDFGWDVSSVAINWSEQMFVLFESHWNTEKFQLSCNYLMWQLVLTVISYPSLCGAKFFFLSVSFMLLRWDERQIFGIKSNTSMVQNLPNLSHLPPKPFLATQLHGANWDKKKPDLSWIASFEQFLEAWRGKTIQYLKKESLGKRTVIKRLTQVF